MVGRVITVLWNELQIWSSGCTGIIFTAAALCTDCRVSTVLTVHWRKSGSVLVPVKVSSVPVPILSVL